MYDIIIIGGGPAGYSAAVRAAQLKANVLLIENNQLGGTCLNNGCIPTKFLWKSVFSKAEKPDLKTLQEAKNKNINLLIKGMENLVKSHHITVIKGTVKFLNSKELVIASEGKNTTLSFGKVIIATGSKPKALPDLSFDKKFIINSTDLLSLDEPPKSLLIMGAGAIGVELALIMNELGCKTTILEKETQVLPFADKDLAQEAQKLLERKGVKIILGNNPVQIDIRNFEKILLAIGRDPNIDSLDLEKVGIKFGKKGIEVNEYLETNVSGIYAAGDVTGNTYLAYISQRDGIIAAENALGEKNKTEYTNIPWAVFTIPPMAHAGKEESKCNKDDIIIGRFPLTANSRSFIEGQRTGFIKIIADKNSKEIIGGSIFGNNADELISIVSLAVSNKLKISDIKRESFFHPSVAESIYGACEDAEGKCVDLPQKTVKRKT